MADIAEILKKAKPPERFVDICLSADLVSQHAALEQQMQDLQANVAAGEGSEARRKKLAAEVRDLEGRMRGETVRFLLRGMSAYQRDEWLEANPPREGKQEAWNPVTGEPALIAACCVDPSMTAEQADELRHTLGGDWDRLVKAAWEASTEASSVPFSFLASVVLQPPSGK